MSLNEYADDVMYRRILNMSAFDDDAPSIGDSTLGAINELLHERKYDPLTEEEIMELFELGASEEFVMFAKFDDGDYNSVRANARAAIDDGRTTFGDFGSYLWEGDMYKATQHADTDNTRRLREIFGVEYINAKSRMQIDHEVPVRGFKVDDRENLVFK